MEKKIDKDGIIGKVVMLAISYADELKQIENGNDEYGTDDTYYGKDGVLFAMREWLNEDEMEYIMDLPFVKREISLFD